MPFRGRLEIAKERHSQWNTQLSLVILSLSVSSSSRCVQNHYNPPTLVSRREKKTCVSVWLLVRSSEVGVPFHYVHLPLKTDTRQKIRGDRSCTHVPTWLTKTLKLAHRRAHWPQSVSVHTLTPIIVTNQITKCIVLFTLPHVTHTQTWC